MGRVIRRGTMGRGETTGSSRSRSRDSSDGRRKSRGHSHKRRLDPLRLQAKALKHVVKGDTRRLRKLLRRDEGHAGLAAVDSRGRTLLHHASACGSEAVVALLLRRGAPAGLADADGDTPAHLAARAGHLAALAELMRAPDAPLLDTPGSRGPTLRELMGRALAGPSVEGFGRDAARGPPGKRESEEAEAGAGAGEGDSDEEERWRRRLREECSEGEDGGVQDEWRSGGAGGGWGAAEGGAGLGFGENDDDWADRLWREMQQRHRAAAAASAASLVADLRAEAAKRAADAAERSRRILQEEKAKDAEWRRRTLAAIEAGPATPPLDLAAAKASYDERWAELDDSAFVAAAAAAASEPFRRPSPTASPPPLLYHDIAWPLEPPPPRPPSVAGPTRGRRGVSEGLALEAGPAPAPALPPAAPSVEALRDFVLLGVSGPAEVKQRLRAELLRWHPDKFGARFGARLAAAGPQHREVALVRVQQLAQVLTQVLAGKSGGGS